MVRMLNMSNSSKESVTNNSALRPTRTMFTRADRGWSLPNCQEHPHTERAISRCCDGRALVGMPLGACGDVGASQVGREVPHARPQQRHGALAAAPARALGGAAVIRLRRAPTRRTWPHSDGPARQRWLARQRARNAGTQTAEQEPADWSRATHKIAGSDLINVRFGPLCGLKSDISRGPRSAKSCREQMQQMPRAVIR